MPFRHYAILAGLLMLASCSPPVDTAVMPPVTGLVDPNNAIYYVRELGLFLARQDPQ